MLAWLSKAEYYGERYTPELIRERLASETTVGGWVDRLMAPAPYGFPMPARNSYDDETKTWTLGALDFSENYDDYIAAVALFRTIANHKDLPGDDGLLIYGYMFGDGGVEVALRIETRASKFLDGSEAESFAAEADAVMEALMAEGAANAAHGEEA
jgi:hypothetical protein